MKTDKEFSLKLGQRIRDLRKKRNLTQEKLAELCGIDHKHIQLLESIRPSNSRVDTVHNIAKALGLNITEFFSAELFEEPLEDQPKPARKVFKVKSPLQEGKYLIEDSLSYAIFDSFPVNRGHCLVLPKRVFANYFDALPEEIHSLWDMVAKVKKYLDREYKPDGYNIGMNIGEAAGQTIQHLHIHVIPRYKGDMPDPEGGVRGVIPEMRKWKKRKKPL